MSRARGTTHPKETVLAISRQISLLLFLLGDGWCTIFQARTFKPLIGSPEICFGLPPNFSEESVKEANDLLVDAIVWGLFDSLFKNLTHEVLVLPQS